MTKDDLQRLYSEKAGAQAAKIRRLKRKNKAYVAAELATFIAAVAMVVGARAGLEVFEYTPMQIKQAVVGYGAAQKNQVQYMVKNILHLNGLPQSDAADALACAICHGYTNKVSAVLGRTTGAISSVNGRWRSPTKW